MRVRPRSGLLVRDPANPPVPLAPSGADVPKTTYWMRRLAKGDVELLQDTEALREIDTREKLTRPTED